MGELLRGRLQSGKGAASHWLQLLNAAYSRKLQMPVYPGSLNLALEHTFDWCTLFLDCDSLAPPDYSPVDVRTIDSNLLLRSPGI